MNHTYASIDNAFNTIKPLRGTDIRPIGNRRNKNERIEQVYVGGGQYAYAATLYDTRCVVYYPDNSVEFQTGGWNTRTTAKFINEYGPCGLCVQRIKGTLWLCETDIDATAKAKKYPIPNRPDKPPLRFVKDAATGRLVPDKPMLIERRVTDRKAARQAREDISKFMDWAKSMLTLSDGWMLHDTITSYFPVVTDGEVYARLTTGAAYEAKEMPVSSDVPMFLFSFASSKDGNKRIVRGLSSKVSDGMLEDWGNKLLTFLSDLHEDDYAYALCLLVLTLNAWGNMLTDARVVYRHPHPLRAEYPWLPDLGYRDVRISYDGLREVMDKFIRASVRKTVQVEASDKILANVV